MSGLSKRSRKRINGIHPVLIDIIEEGIATSPYDFGIPAYGGARTHKDQRDLYAIGRTVQKHLKPVTWTLNSKHLINRKTGYGHAFDIYAFVNGKASWDLKYLEPIARHLQKVAKRKGSDLQWGQDLWGKDGAHFQIELD
jgi:peptidoglycan L-alanyl-D-glutamate endopeptidase CwlK